MSALEIELGPAGAQCNVRVEHGVIVPPYEPGAPADGPPIIELTEGDEALDLDDEPLGDIDVIVGEPIEHLVAERRHELTLVTRAIAEDLPAPRPPTRELPLSVATALMNLGCDMRDENVRTVSIEHLRMFARQMPMDASRDALAAMGRTAAESLGLQLAVTAGDLLHSRFGDALVRELGHDACCALSEMLMREVTMPFRQACLAANDPLADLAWRSWHDAHRVHIGLTLTGRHAEKPLVTPFIEMFRRGHFPVGFLKDRTFLVITG